MTLLIELLPKQGMDLDGKSIRFGQSRTEVEALLGVLESVQDKRCYFYNSELALDFDGDDRLEFIEFLGGADSVLRPKLYGQDAFSADADELLAQLIERNGDDIDDSEAGYSYALRELSIGLYREITPADVDEMVKEMSRIDLTTMGHFNLENEIRRSRRWETIGIGKEHYYA